MSRIILRRVPPPLQRPPRWAASRRSRRSRCSAPFCACSRCSSSAAPWPCKVRAAAHSCAARAACPPAVDVCDFACHASSECILAASSAPVRLVLPSCCLCRPAPPGALAARPRLLRRWGAGAREERARHRPCGHDCVSGAAMLTCRCCTARLVLQFVVLGWYS